MAIMSDDTSLEPVRNVHMWIEQGAVHLKAADHGVDPVELAEHEVERVIAGLQTLLKRLRDEDAG